MIRQEQFQCVYEVCNISNSSEASQNLDGPSLQADSPHLLPTSGHHPLAHLHTMAELSTWTFHRCHASKHAAPQSPMHGWVHGATWDTKLRHPAIRRTASVASGVTSLGAGPVPPVVTTKQQPSSSHCHARHSCKLDASTCSASAFVRQLQPSFLRP